METIQDLVANSGYGLNSIKDQLLREGAKEIRYTYNIARGENSFDIFTSGERFLVIESSQESLEIYSALSRARVPLVSNSPIHLKGWIFAHNIPMSTMPLDSRTYPEQEFTQGGHVGAMEIMQQIGTLLAEVKDVTGKLPSNFSLSSVALMNGEEDFVRLLPPIELSGESDINSLSGRILDQLDKVDPNNDHRLQVKALVKAFSQYHK